MTRARSGDCEVVSRDPSRSLDLRRAPCRFRSIADARTVVRSALEIRSSRVLMQRPSPGLSTRSRQSEEQRRALRADRACSPSWRAARGARQAPGRDLARVRRRRRRRLRAGEDLRLAEELAQRAALAVENARLYRAAQRAIQARDDVLGIVAHDLRNPLGDHPHAGRACSGARGRSPSGGPEARAT